jgi:hypothetical protein
MARRSLIGTLLWLLSMTATPAFAQDFGVAYATTDIAWDSGTNTVSASCALQLDYNAQAYYSTALNCYIYYGSNTPAHVVANNWGYGSDHAEVDLASGSAWINTTYSTQGAYFVNMYYSVDFGDTYYYDPFYFLYFEFVGVNAPQSYEFDGSDNPGFVPFNGILLGYLYDSVTTP